MISLFARIFLGNKQRSAAEERQAYGVLCGAVGIGLNILLFAGKFLAGTLSHSIAITADAFNNLSDAGSSLVTLLGFRLAGQEPDQNHPFGHGRMEYLSGLAVAMLILLSLCNELDVLALGEETAQGLGMNVKTMRTLFLLLAAMLAGASVSFAGLLGFVGLIVPHAARKLLGSESRNLLPLCALGGAGFVCGCDLAARLIFDPYELPVGILMAVLGGPFFLLLLAKGKGGRSND